MCNLHNGECQLEEEVLSDNIRDRMPHWEIRTEQRIEISLTTWNMELT